MTQQVASNSIVLEYSKQALKLGLLPELESLLKPALMKEINQALNSALDVSLKLEIVSQPKLDVETPHLARERELREIHQAAIESIKQQDLVKQLGNAFGAKLLEASVTEIKTKTTKSKEVTP